MADEDEGEQEEEGGFKNLGVVSSCFSIIAYNESTRTLQMTFSKDGRSYLIENLEPIEVYRWVNSGSPGGYFNSFVRGRY